jgi:hypothetical protein|tara:strand:- start:297 stop:926 length:630 start_codon:yes stop_codon:yes gene_type:complete
VSGLISNYKMTALTKMDISKVSLNNQYQVNISGITADLKGYLGRYYNIPNNYASGGDIGIMCAEATLPTSSFATSEVKDNFHGVNQQFAHTRIYIDSDFSFYIDDNYNVLKFFEGWMDYISGDDNSEFRRDDDVNYYRRFNYPMNTDRKIGYKCGSLTISKFEKNFGKSIKYSFINAFPKAMISIPVQYGGADLLKVNVQFAYDRYNLI